MRHSTTGKDRRSWTRAVASALVAPLGRAAVSALVAASVVLSARPGALEAQNSADRAQDGNVLWLEGRVVEAGSGEGIAGVEMRVTGPVECAALSDADGAWRLGPLAPGRYALHAEHLGFASRTRDVSVPRDGDSPVRISLSPSPLPLDAVVVTAGRRRQRLADAVVATELITAPEIRETGSSDLSSVLTERTGLELQGGHPAGAGVMIQGMGSERVLILLDGQPFIGRISGTTDVSRIPTSMIERVEVVKGPQSTLYGSEAMGGVVNVITRTPDEQAWSAGTRITAGDRGRMDVSLDAMGGMGPVAGVLDAGHRGIELAPGRPGTGGARSARWDGLAKVSWRTPVRGLGAEASAFLVDERQEWRSGQLGHFIDNRQWSARLAGALDRAAHRLSGTLYATAFEHLARTSPGAEPVPGTGDEETQRLAEGELLYGLEMGRHALDAGLEVGRESIRSGRVRGGHRTETTVESFVQTTLSWGGASVVPGVRGTWSELWGTHWSPRLAVLYRPRPELGLRVSVGRGFRAPSFKELSMEFLNIGPGFGYTVRGNPDVRPETSRNLTASVEWSGDRAWMRVQGFDNRFRDFIETRLVGDSTGIQVYTYGNVDDGFTRGTEVEAGLSLDAWSLEAGWSLLRAEDEATGEPLLGRPEHSARGTLGYTVPGGPRLSVSGVHTGRTPMQRTDAGTEWREAFLRFDARASWRLPGGLELTAGVDNLLDEQIDDWPGFTGRHVYTTVSWRAVGGSGTR